MTDLPAPLTPLDCDLRGLQFMPLYGDVLFASATWIGAKPEAKVAALRLWWHAYAKEVPAASLPDDDALLAEYAGYGVAVAAWRKIRAQAMRGWIKCADDRLYHRIVADRALEAWKMRKRNREKQRQWREKAKPRDAHVTVSETVTSQVTGPSRRPLRNAGQGQGYIPPKAPKGADGRSRSDSDRFIAEIRKAMSPTGVQRLKPAICAKLLPSLIAKHGFDALLAAARAFYATPEARKDNGQFQAGLQTALRDGRIEALIIGPAERTAERAKWVRRLADGDLFSGWTREIAAIAGPAPSPDELAAAQETGGTAP